MPCLYTLDLEQICLEVIHGLEEIFGTEEMLLWTVASSTIIPVFPSSDYLWHSISRRGVWGSAGAA